MRLAISDQPDSILASCESRRRLERLLVVLCLVVVLGCKAETSAKPPWQGQLGGNLGLLEQRLRDQSPSPESNVSLDLVSPGRLSRLSALLGLTNNRTLFVDTHGKSLPRSRGGNYVMYPDLAGRALDETRELFTVRDLAVVLGSRRSSEIHNIFVSGCNVEGRLQPQEFRKYFPNATNIMHQPAGQLSFGPMLLQTLALHSQDVHPLYSKRTRDSSPTPRYELFTQPELDTKRLTSYVAQLYRPGSRKPYLQVTAGRERLDPGWKAGSKPLPSSVIDRSPTDPVRRLLDLE